MFFYRLKQFILLIVDLALLYFSLWLALLIRYHQVPSASLWQLHLLPFSIIFFIWLVVFYLSNLYNFNLLKSRFNFYLNLFRSLLINFILAAIIFYFSGTEFTPRRILFLNLLVFAILFSIWRLIANRFLGQIGPLSNLLIVSDNQDARELIKKQHLLLTYGFKLRVVIELEKKDFKPTPGQYLWLEYDLENFEKIIKEGQISTVVVSNLSKHSEIAAKLYHLLPQGIRFFDLSTFYENFFKQIPISTTSEIWFLENFRNSQKKFYDYLKRLLDIILALVLIPISFLFYPFIILGILTSSPGPVFYRQKRVGKDGREFILTKFRTMIVGAEKNGAVWATKNDPRVILFGRFLRASHLDELPQLWSILKGDMSLVGPRPERPEFVKDLTTKIPHYHLRHLIKPGFTGWAQINYPYGASIEDALKKLHYDLYYIKNRSLFLDLIIILKTINIFLRQPGKNY
ncbi:MAG: sugar transferase [Minisyncoccia bacterium]